MERSQEQEALIQLESSIAKTSFYEFIKMAWSVLNPDPDLEFVDGKMMRLVCAYMEACVDGRVKNLLINLPIRHSKSSIISVYFHPWVWASKPGKRFLFTTYNENRALDDALQSRKLIESQWYKEHFPEVRLSSDSNQKGLYTNTKNGVRMSAGMEGSVQGVSADYLITDDPNRPGDSDIDRDRVIKVYNESVWPRARNVKTAVRIVMQQRLHVNDLSGSLLNGPNKDKWTHLCLPAIYDHQRFESPLGPEYNDWRTEEGEILWPERFSQDDIETLKNQLGSELAIAGQLQQLPFSEGGVVFQKSFFQNRYSLIDDYLYRFLSFDTASATNDGSAYTSGIVAALLPNYQLAIIDCFHERVTFPKLVETIEDMSKKYKHKLRACVIESASTGLPALDTLKQNEKGEMSWLVPLLYGFKPVGGKRDRASLASVWCANGSVILPELTEINSNWMEPFEDEVFSFPQSPYRDIVDSFSQLILFTQKWLAKGLAMRVKNNNRR